MNRRALAVGAVVLGLACYAAWARRAAPAGSIVDDAQAIAEDAVSAVTGWTLPARAAPYAVAIARAEAAYGIPQNMLARLLYQESRFREDIISGATVSPTGAQGIAQFMPATAAELGVDPLNPASAIDGAARYLAKLARTLGDWRLALAAYNWGIGNVQRKGLDRAPEETRRYVAEITGDIGYA